jgi:hypothetical protein
VSSETDPARELADLCDALRAAPSQIRGDEAISKVLGVEAWSSEFYQIVFSITSRIDELVAIVKELSLDCDYQEEAVGHLRQIGFAFSQNGLGGNWQNSIDRYISPQHVQAVKMLSGQVRAVRSYAKLDDKETAELLAEIDQLLEWLREHQLKDRDFIRQALIDGLVQFRFRLARIKWLGWGYTLESLRDVIGAYMALERGMPDPGVEPTAEAMLKKTLGLVEAAYKKLKTVKGVVETGDFLLRMYGAAAAIHNFGIAGFLTIR